MNFIYDLHRTMMSQNLILVYQGDFTQESTKSILSMAERNLDSSGEDSSIKRKVFNVMVEALQNIVKHSDELVDGQTRSHAAIFLIGNFFTHRSIRVKPIQSHREFTKRWKRFFRPNIKSFSTQRNLIFSD